MNCEPALLTLIDGFPREPGAGNWEDVISLPGPRSLLEAVFVELCGVSLNDMPETEDAGSGQIDDDWQTRSIVVGRDGVGFRQVERKCIETSALPCHETIETFGLPELELTWAFHLELAGQFGHSAFRHDRLTARFANDVVRQRFEGIWNRVFAVMPVFEEAG